MSLVCYQYNYQTEESTEYLLALNTKHQYLEQVEDKNRNTTETNTQQYDNREFRR